MNTLLKNFHDTESSIRLPQKLSRHSYTYEQIWRNEKLAIYSQTLGGKIIGYEVFKIKFQRERIFMGIFFPRKERFPYDGEFGCSAWTLGTIEDAYTKLNSIINEDR